MRHDDRGKTEARVAHPNLTRREFLAAVAASAGSVPALGLPMIAGAAAPDAANTERTRD